MKKSGRREKGAALLLWLNFFLELCKLPDLLQGIVLELRAQGFENGQGLEPLPVFRRAVKHLPLAGFQPVGIDLVELAEVLQEKRLGVYPAVFQVTPNFSPNSRWDRWSASRRALIRLCKCFLPPFPP